MVDAAELQWSADGKFSPFQPCKASLPAVCPELSQISGMPLMLLSANTEYHNLIGNTALTTAAQVKNHVPRITQ